MSDAGVQFDEGPGEETSFSFRCPKADRFCGNLLIRGKNTDMPQTPQWGWDGNREAPTFTPSVNCIGCWHGYIRAGRCVDTSGNEEPAR